MEALKGDGDAEIRALGRHLGFQGQDAVKQVLRFAPDDAALSEKIQGMCDDIRLFAARETQSAMEFALSGQGIPPEKQDEEGVDQRGTMVVKRLRWRSPADDAFSESGQAKVRAMRERVNGNLARIWNWINGRRTAEEIYERLQFGGTVPYDVVVEYLELLIGEGFASLVM
jgi:hypothetical protein